MLCDICKTKNARIFFTEIINGKKREQKLCEDCAKAQNSYIIKDPLSDGEIPLSAFISKLLNNRISNNGEQGDLLSENLVCPMCGQSLAEFMNEGKLGCSTCYLTFDKFIERKIGMVQGAIKHIGKKPKSSAIKEQKIKQKKLTKLDELTIKLQQAIEVENFEQAALLRDEIKELKAASEEKKVKVHNEK